MGTEEKTTQTKLAVMRAYPDAFTKELDEHDFPAGLTSQTSCRNRIGIRRRAAASWRAALRPQPEIRWS